MKKRLMATLLALVMLLSLLPISALAASGAEEESSGIKFDKTASGPDGDGNYTVTMTAQATKETTTTTTTAPLDIVLVLDQSGSMAFNFAGNSTSNNTARRQYAMKQAVNGFIAKVAENYSASADHRMAIVTFADNASTLVGWTEVDADGKTTLANEISWLKDNPSGATNVAAGMDEAAKLMNSAGTDDDRQQVVIVFTDGVPTKDSDFDTAVADSAIATAKDMKDDGVTIYTVGIFNGANPAQLYGDKVKTKDFGEYPCDGAVGQLWGATDLAAFFAGNDFVDADVPAGNRFLNYLSSNFSSPNRIGIEGGPFDKTEVQGYEDTFKNKFWALPVQGYKITENFKRAASGYYLAASNMSGLEGVFTKITSTIIKPANADLNDSTEITDTLSDYFTFATSAPADNVKVYAVAGEDKREITDAVDISVSGKTVTVTGYDFSKHYEGSSDEETLVIEITVKPDANADWGPGGNYPTNKGNAAVMLEGEEIASAKSPEVPVGTYQVTYQTNYPAGTLADATATAASYYLPDAEVGLEDDSLFKTPDGYTFAGWTVVSPDGVTIENNKLTMPESNVVLKAQWTANEYTVTYTDGVEGETIFADVVKGASFNAAIPTFGTSDPTRTGYNFTGWEWYSVSGTTETKLDAKPETMPANNLKAVAQWTANKYTVTYTDGVEGETIFADVVKGASFNAAIPAFGTSDPTRTGYDFTGWEWYSVNGTTETKLDAKPETMPANNLKAVAQWSPRTDLEYTVKYLESGTNAELVSSKTRTGKTFGETYEEIAEDVTGYTVDAAKKSITISKVSGNELIFYYVKAYPDPATFNFNYAPEDYNPAITKTVKGYVGKNFEEIFEVTVKPGSDKEKATMGSSSYTGRAEVSADYRENVPFWFGSERPQSLKIEAEEAFTSEAELRFTKEGTYTYTVKEEKGNTSRMSYDRTEYTLTIEVTLNKEKNALEVTSWQFTNKEANTPLNIVNTYRTYSPSTPSSKPKLNTGDHLAYVVGYPDGTVRPNGSITRAEVSAILFRLLADDTRDEYFTSVSSFTDVKAGTWYNNSVATLEKAGVIVDTAAGGAFRPNEAITRAELAAMLAQFADAKPVSGVKFTDVSTDHWAYDAIAIAAKMSWIEGYPDGTFRPDATITRAEMMTLVNRALERVPSDEDHLLSPRVMLTFPDCNPGDWFYIAVQEATNSHTYERAATEKNGDEQWIALRDNRDWTAYEN